MAVTPTENALPVYKDEEGNRRSNLQPTGGRPGRRALIEPLDQTADKLDERDHRPAQAFAEREHHDEPGGAVANLRVASEEADLAVSNINVIVVSQHRASLPIGSNLVAFSEQMNEAGGNAARPGPRPTSPHQRRRPKCGSPATETLNT